MNLSRKAEILVAGILAVSAAGCKKTADVSHANDQTFAHSPYPPKVGATVASGAKLTDPDDGIPVHMLTPVDVKKNAENAIFGASGAVSETLGSQNIFAVTPYQVSVINKATNEICGKHWVKACSEPSDNASSAIVRAEGVASEIWMRDVGQYHGANTKGHSTSHALKMEYQDSARLIVMNQEIAPALQGSQNPDGWLTDAKKPKLGELRMATPASFVEYK